MALMNGLSLSPSGLMDVNLTRNRTWHVAGIGDMDGDGRDDVLLRNENGAWHYYSMRGSRPGPGRGRVDMTRSLAWSLADLGDITRRARRHANIPSYSPTRDVAHTLV